MQFKAYMSFFTFIPPNVYCLFVSRHAVYLYCYCIADCADYISINCNLPTACRWKLAEAKSGTIHQVATFLFTSKQGALQINTYINKQAGTRQQSVRH